jgi:hypothetical protein
MKMNLPVKILVMIGSSASIGFGIWHFFVPTAWNWYSYIDSNATELVAYKMMLPIIPQALIYILL